ncbi:hypothetical protein QVD17_27105 [Tagetes erecta]|uniref:Uncharacterized protein n=1 Tax=Tagetes erecta TaxID=13708 RepID=A0AAD8K7W0_TARER|nr:hypothetical protein QVD17_27105 [Tagetes erecta]
MLDSSSSSHHHHHQNQELQLIQSDPGLLNNHHQIPPFRRLLLTCAHSISHSDFTAADRIITILSGNSSGYGDSSERLIHCFTGALRHRLRLHLHPPPPPSLPDDAILQSSYLSLNRITPFIRFCHLTANQAILEAIQLQKDHHHHHQGIRYIHILDFDIMHGVQWPPLMQAIADLHPPPSLRITATGTNIRILHKTGDRLTKFAHSLNLTFQFSPLLLPHHHTVDDIIHRISGVHHSPNEILAVNCVLHLHRLLTNRDKLCSLLRKIKTMNPKIVTLAENEANHNHPIFTSRFEQAVNYYTAVFDSLEATLPPRSEERREVEQVWFGKEIVDIVSWEGDRRRERHERLSSWEMMMRIAGFGHVSVSQFGVTQAKLLLRLHYPSEGFNIEVVNDSLLLGWKNQPLFTVSSWQ